MTTTNTVLNPAEFSADEAAAVADAVARVHSKTEYKLDMRAVAQQVFDAAQVSAEPDITDRKQLAVLGAAVPVTRQAALDAEVAFTKAHTELAQLNRAHPWPSLGDLDMAVELDRSNASSKAKAAEQSLASAVVAQIRAAEANAAATTGVGLHRVAVLKARQVAGLTLFNGLLVKYGCPRVAFEGAFVSYDVAAQELVVDFEPHCKKRSGQSGDAMFTGHKHSEHQHRYPCELASQPAAK